MATRRKRAAAGTGPPPDRAPLPEPLAAALAWLERKRTRRDLENLTRFGIAAERPFGVSMANLKLLAKQLGRRHDLAAALWKTGRYEARLLAALIDEPDRVTAAQMDKWARDFDNWGLCDTACFALFDRTPHAWKKVGEWAGRKEEFVRRAAFALLWGLTVHDREAADAAFLRGLALIERAATDERHFVKKAVNMALRAVGKRNRTLNAAAVAVARRLADSPDETARWVGKGALRELLGPVVARRLAAVSRRTPK